MKINKLNLPAPSPSTSFLTLALAEVGDCQLEYEAYGSKERVRLRFQRCIAGRMDDCGEAAGTDATIGEIVNSEWLSHHVAEQRKRYPRSPNALDGIRHFFVKGHDTIVEVLAEGYTSTIGSS